MALLKENRRFVASPFAHLPQFTGTAAKVRRTKIKGEGELIRASDAFFASICKRRVFTVVDRKCQRRLKKNTVFSRARHAHYWQTYKV